MPGFDRTGPWGGGPLTGGGRGFCSSTGGRYSPVYGGGFGRSRAFERGSDQGRGYGICSRARGSYPYSRGGYKRPYGPHYSIDPSEEINMLRAEADAIKGNLDEINRRIGELQKMPREQ